MTKDTALRLALEALETSMYPQQKQLQAITAIKAALEAKGDPDYSICPTCGGMADDPIVSREHRFQSVALEAKDSDKGKVDQLRVALMKANNQAEHFEREWYLRGDEIERLKAALEAKDEPVAWMDGYRNIYSLEEKAAGCPEATIPLGPIANQLANQRETSGSPVVSELYCICGAEWEWHNRDWELVATSPTAQRQWVGLTDEEIVLIVAECAASHQHTDIHFARAIEAKLKEKNT